MKQSSLSRQQLSGQEIALVKIAKQAAHDIRSPLSALNMVIGTLEMLSDEKRGLLFEALQRINHIADELLSQCRVQNFSEDKSLIPDPRAAFDIPIATLNIGQLLDEYMKLKSLEFFDHSLKLHKEFNGNLEHEVQANEQTLKRVLSNLFNNSAEAGSTAIHVSISEVGSSFLIALKENGQGIPKPLLQRLSSGEAVSFGKDGVGSGLGLSHARASIAAMGGSLTINSRENMGTTILIRLAK